MFDFVRSKAKKLNGRLLLLLLLLLYICVLSSACHQPLAGYLLYIAQELLHFVMLLPFACVHSCKPLRSYRCQTALSITKSNSSDSRPDVAHQALLISVADVSMTFMNLHSCPHPFAPTPLSPPPPLVCNHTTLGLHDGRSPSGVQGARLEAACQAASSVASTQALQLDCCHVLAQPQLAPAYSASCLKTRSPPGLWLHLLLHFSGIGVRVVAISHNP